MTTRRATLLVAILFMSMAGMAQKIIDNPGKLCHLDLLFVIAQQPNAITEVTSGADNYEIDHVGVLVKENGKMKVIEAVYEGVREIDYEQFVRSNKHILVGRIRKGIDKAQTFSRLRSLLGRPYDFVFMPGTEAVYCSELVSECFVNKTGQRLLPPVTMSFHDAQGRITPYWTDFYSRRGKDVPEGLPGTNPGEMSKRANVKIKYQLRQFAK